MSRPTPPVRIDGRLQAPLCESPAFVLMQAGRLAMEWTAEALQLFELTVAQFATLTLITRAGPIGQSGVGERLGMGKSAMSRVAARLVAAGFAERRLPLHDGRQRLLCPTRAGVEAVSDAADELAEVDAQFLERIGEDTVAALAQLPPPTLGAMEKALVTLGWN